MMYIFLKRHTRIAVFPIERKWKFNELFIAEEDSNSLLQLHSGTTILQMTAIAVFIEKEDSHPRHDQIRNWFPMLAYAQNHCVLVVSKYSMFN